MSLGRCSDSAKAALPCVTNLTSRCFMPGESENRQGGISLISLFVIINDSSASVLKVAIRSSLVFRERNGTSRCERCMGIVGVSRKAYFPAQGSSIDVLPR